MTRLLLVAALLWPRPALPSGPKLFVKVYNAAGEVVRTFPYSMVGISVTTMSLSYTASGGCTTWTNDPAQPFSPDGDCTNDLLKIGFPELTNTTTGESYVSHWWDGATDAGAWAPNGLYLVRAETTATATGSPVTIIVPVTLSALRSTVEARIYGASGLLVRTLTSISLPGITGVRVDPNPYAPEITGRSLVTFRLLNSSGGQIGLLTWDGRDGEGTIVPNGTYTLSLRAVAPGGGETNLTASFTVLHDDLALIRDVHPVPNPATSNGGVVWFAYRTVAPNILASVRLTLWSAAGERIWSRDLSRQLPPSDPLDADGDGLGSVSWNLRTESNREAGSGLYVAMLEVTGAANLTQRATTKVAVK